MSVNQEGIGTLKLECPQSHPVGRILREAPHQAIMFDPGAQVGARRFWPDEDEQPRFKVNCRFCDKPVGDVTATLQDRLREVLADESETTRIATLPYL